MNQENLAGLTPHQKKAVEIMIETQKKRMFIGASPEIRISDFKAINVLRLTDPEKAELREKSLFALCGYDPLNTI